MAAGRRSGHDLQRVITISCNVMLIILAVSTAATNAKAASSPPRPPVAGLILDFPKFPSKDMACNFDKSLNISEALVCTPNGDGQIVFSNDDDVISVRYQYKKKVQLWKKGSPFAASFSTQFTVKFQRDFERSVKRVFGGGIAFAITPTSNPGSAGPESLGLFPIQESTGKPSANSSSPNTVAVEIDTSRDTTYSWDPPIPHVGLDVNSVHSTVSRFLWNGTKFVDRKLAVFIDYDAHKETLAVRFQNLTATSEPDKRKAKVFLAYSHLDLSRYVREQSYVGFSSRVPVTTDGVYFLYNWKFATKWVLKKGVKL